MSREATGCRRGVTAGILSLSIVVVVVVASALQAVIVSHAVEVMVVYDEAELTIEE